MSTPLALAAVTAVMRGLLYDVLVTDGAVPGLPGLEVTAVAPPKDGGGNTPRLNLFLYAVSPNAARRNAELPARDARGARLTNAPLALDLHYLLTAYGIGNFQSEAMLGLAMYVLHETPILTAALIERLLERGEANAGEAAISVSAEDLRGQLGEIRVTPEPMGLEELSKLWSAFQAPYRPSAAYTASAVLIEGARPTRAVLPVLGIGRDNTGIVVGAGAGLPLLSLIELPRRQPAAQLGDTLTLRGRNLEGDNLTVLIQGRWPDSLIELSPQGGATAERVEVSLPKAETAGDKWAPGHYTIALRLRRGNSLLRTNVLSLALAPRLRIDEAITLLSYDDPIKIYYEPLARPDQHVSLLVGDREIMPEPDDEHVADATFKLPKGMAPGTYALRLRVDGVDSLPFDPQKPSRTFDPQQTIEIPPSEDRDEGGAPR